MSEQPINFPANLQAKINQRKQENSLRQLTTMFEGVDFYSNDYLGFSLSASIYQQAHQIASKYSYHNGSTGSRLISGTHQLHLAVEKQLANFHNAQVGLLYNSGYDANVGLFSAILQKGDVILYDELIHASVRDGIQQSLSKSYKFQHNNLEDLAHKLKKFSQEFTNVYIAVETVYSMDGDGCPLQAIVTLAKQYQAYVIVDEAHATGVFGENGKGLVCDLGLENDIFARVHTFGKAMGCHGAIVLGSEALRTYLINFSRAFIYTTAIPIHNVATIQVAYETLLQTNAITQLKENIAYFKKQLLFWNLETIFIDSQSAIQCCLVPGNDNVKKIANLLAEHQLNVKPILSPTVKKGEERIRICLHAFNTEEEIDKLLSTLKFGFINE